MKLEMETEFDLAATIMVLLLPSDCERCLRGREARRAAGSRVSVL